MRYFTFGMKYLRVTQSWNQGNHIPHWKNSKDFSDYPIDIAGEDYNRSPYYATVDMKVTSIKGHKEKYTDMIWLEALEVCHTPIGDIKPFIGLCHWNQDDPYIAKLKVGSIVKAGDIICLEGTDGNTSGNHLHMICGDSNRGTGTKLIKNSNGVWVSDGYCYKPEEIMFINLSFTEVIETNGIDFKYIDILYSKGDSSDSIKKIDDFLSDKIKGNYYGDYTESAVSTYKRKNGIKNIDGEFIDRETFKKMKDDGIEL